MQKNENDLPRSETRKISDHRQSSAAADAGTPIARAERPNCYACVYRGEVPGSAHSSCQHPATEATRRSPFMHLAGIVGKRGGDQLASMASAFNEGPERAAAQLHISAAPHGIRNGWFIWPMNFDPVWLQTCDGFTPKAEGEK